MATLKEFTAEFNRLSRKVDWLEYTEDQLASYYEEGDSPQEALDTLIAQGSTPNPFPSQGGR